MSRYIEKCSCGARIDREVYPTHDIDRVAREWREGHRHEMPAPDGESREVDMGASIEMRPQPSYVGFAPNVPEWEE